MKVPFQKDITIFLEKEGVIKAKEPEITLVDLKIDKLTDSSGKMKEIQVTTNISIYNPNTVPFILQKPDYERFAMDKKGETLKVNSTLPGALVSTNKMIEPGDAYIYSGESRVSDGNGFLYLSEEKPRYLRIRGTSVLVTNESGCSPFYFEPGFNTLITVGEANKNEITHLSLKLNLNKASRILNRILNKKMKAQQQMLKKSLQKEKIQATPVKKAQICLVLKLFIVLLVFPEYSCTENGEFIQ